MPPSSRILLLLVCLIFYIPLLYGQASPTEGLLKIIDASTSEPIANALLQTNDGRYLGSSDYEGRLAFQLELQADETPLLLVSAFAYVTDTLKLADVFTAQRVKEVRLQSVSLSTVVVTSSVRPRERTLSPSLATLQSVPVILGQSDPLKSLQVYPGISGGQEGLSGLFIRGGSAEQNLLLLDRGRIYHPGHLFGFLSVFNPAALRSVDVYKDHIPASYGGGLSSVISLTTLDGDPNRRRVQKEIGLLTASYSVNGPTKDSTLTYLFGLRLAHSALLTLGTLPTYLAGTTPLAVFGTSDLNGKLVKRLPNGRKLSLSLYAGEDIFGALSRGKEDEAESGNALLGQGYGNRLIGLRYFSPGQNKGFSETYLGYSGYYNQTRVRESSQNGEDFLLFKQTGNLREFNLEHRRYFFVGSANVEVGLEAAWLKLEPIRTQIKSTDDSVEPERFFSRVPHAATYVKWEQPLLKDRIEVEAGLRLGVVHQVGTAFTQFAVEPRVSLNVLDNWGGEWQLSYNRTVQEVHSVSVLIGGFPNLFWVPPSAALPLEYADQFSVGWRRRWTEKGEISIGGYLRHLNEQVFFPGISFGTADNREWEDLTVKGGKGEAYGVEAFWEMNWTRRFNTRLSYTYSRSLRTFADFNNGETFPFDFDRPHDLYVATGVQLSNKWRLDLAFYYQTGRPYTLPTAVGTGYNGFTEYFFSEWNNVRLPDYERLDLVMTHDKINRKGRKASWKFGVYNIYGHRNPLFALFSNEIRNFVASRTVIEYNTLFRFMPIISYAVEY